MIMPAKGLVCAAFVLCFLAAVASDAQDDPAPRVETIGEATAEAPPDYANFNLTLVASGATIGASTQVLLRFEEDLRKALDEEDLTPNAVTMSGVRIAGVEGTQASIDARLRFDFLGSSTSEGRARTLATTVDGLRKAVTRLKCAVSGPLFGVTEVEPVEQEAVARATENAFYLADAIASLLGVSIVAVERASVVEVTWLESAGDVQGLSCTARVRVNYLLETP